MASKLDKGVYPDNASPNDFQCFGPPATKDGEFDAVKIADLGCFDQDGKDSNKYYHGAVVQHRTSKQWFVYFEWGRTGAAKPSFQFVKCSSEAEAQSEFADQLHDKNDKRGQWTTVAGIRTLKAKPNKDCYLVRPQATRSTGLPDAKTIKANEGSKAPAAAAPVVGKTDGYKIDSYTQKLMSDLSMATVSYTRGAMADSSLPTQSALDEARQILGAAQKRLIVVGDSVEKQVADKELLELTRLMYSRIPKKKELHSEAAAWILNQGNILLWTADIDAFESALHTVGASKIETDPFAGMAMRMEWIDPKTALGKWLYNWWPKATANRHGYIGNMKVKNIWKVEKDNSRFEACQGLIAKQKPKVTERPLFQPERMDLGTLAKTYLETNTSLLFHGTRSVNVSGILREGLRLPKELVGVVVTGAMFGPGQYYADDWKKSAGYTSLAGSYWSSGGGAVQGRDAFMFACDVVLGSAYVAPGPSGYTKAPSGHHSVFGKAGHSQVQNNEWIVYDAAQHSIKYLCEFSTN